MATTPSFSIAIESSCDETAVALVTNTGQVLEQSLSSQIGLHQKFGGVVPELASRAHFEVIADLFEDVFKKHPERKPAHADFVCATRGPGLIGPLLVGSTFAEGLAKGLNKPFIGVHHLRGHIASAFLTQEPSTQTLKDQAQEIFPALVLLVSGGHTSILKVDPTLEIRELARTVDDAAGECFDKSAKLMGLGYPGGPAIEKLAIDYLKDSSPESRQKAEALARSLPRPKSATGDFSFSGLKTAIRLAWEKRDEKILSVGSFAWCVQEVIADTLATGLQRTLTKVPPDDLKKLKTVIFCGGVAANQRVRERLLSILTPLGLPCAFPPLSFCTDNAAMIGAAAWMQSEKLNLRTTTARVAL